MTRNGDSDFPSKATKRALALRLVPRFIQISSLSLLTLVLGAGCTVPNTYQHLPSGNPLNPDGPRLAVLDLTYSTSVNANISGGFTTDSQTWINSYTQTLACAARNTGEFSGVQVIELPSRSLPRERTRLLNEGYDYALSSELLELESDGGPHPISAINPLSLGMLLGLPTGYGWNSASQDLRISLVDVRTGIALWHETITKKIKRDVWVSFWGINNMGASGTETLRRVTQGIAFDFEQRLASAIREHANQTRFASPGGRSGVTVLSPAPVPASIRNVHVLVIGVKKYQDKTIPPLRYSGSDAKAVYDFFKSSPRSPARPENVHYLGDEPNDDGLCADRKES